MFNTKNTATLLFKYHLKTGHKWIIFSSVIITILFISPCGAQAPGYSVIQYNTDNGLPQSSVKSILFDKAGYCWLATEMGLVRFDGRNFKVYGMSEVPGITSDRIKIMASSLSGDLYALTGNDERIVIHFDKFRGSPFPTIIHDKTKYLPISGYVTAKTHIDSLNDEMFRKYQHPQGSEGISTSGGAIYLSSQENIYYVTKKKALEIHDSSVGIPSWEKNIVGGNFYVHFYPQNKIRVWENGILRPLMKRISGPLENDKNYLAGKAKVVWCTEGTYVYSGKTLYQITIVHDEMVSKIVLEDLAIKNLASIYYSREQKKYYFGSQIDGLYIVEKSSFDYPSMPGEADIDNFSPQSITPSGDIFSGDILFSRDKSSKYTRTQSRDGMTHIVTQDNQLYFDSNFKLCRYDLNTKQTFTILPLERRLRFLLPEGKNLTFCTRRSIGMLSNDSLVFKKDFPDQIRLITAIKLDKENFLLATESGLKWYNLPDNKIHKSILDSLQIRTMHQDSGRLWIASYGKGFFLYEKGKIHKMPFGSKNALKTVHSFIDDGAGHFWLPTNNGLFRVSKSELLEYAHGKSSNLYFYMMTKQNGLRTNEFNGGCDPSFLRMQDGMLSLPSINGLVWFYPDKMNFIYPNKNIYVDGLFINKKKITTQGGKIVLEPAFSELSIQVSCPYFGNPQNINLEYRILGLNNTWNAVPEGGEIKLSRTPPGNYNVIIRRASGITHAYQTLEMAMEIKPWFYNTWWFYLFLTLSFGFIAYLIGKHRLKSVTERSNQLELLVSGRTEELSRAIEHIAESESALLKSTRVKDRVITMVLHDLRSPIRFLTIISDHLASHYQALNSEELGEKLSELHGGTKALRGFTEQFFTWAISQHENFRVTNTTFSMQVFFGDMVDLYADIARSRGNVLSVEPTSIHCHTDYQILSLIVRNLIDNASKNTTNGLISLRVTASENAVVLYVKDTGKGLTSDQVKSFIDESKGMGNEGTGSILILNMIQKIGGTLEITTTVDKGSLFSIRLNHPQPHDISGQDCSAQSDF